MLKNREFLTKILLNRLEMGGLSAKRYLDEACEVIVFGSMSVGLERPNSDIDVLCVGSCDYKLKTDLLDLIVVPVDATKSQLWRESELASHIGEYGTWIKGTPQWRSNLRVGSKVIDDKRNRISAFMRSLPSSWPRLQECFRSKYSVKLRREVERLILLERGVAIPPTRILDYSWTSISKSSSEVCDRLRQFACDDQRTFIADLLARVETHFQSHQAEN
jgi:predicted nucleotidyltransferase